MFKHNDDQLLWIELVMSHSCDVEVCTKHCFSLVEWSTTNNFQNLSV
jgi:hypothetical protein